MRAWIEVVCLCLGYGLFLPLPLLLEVPSRVNRKYLCEYASDGYAWPMRAGWSLFTLGLVSLFTRHHIPWSLVSMNFVITMVFVGFVDVTTEDARMLLLHQLPLAVSALVTLALLSRIAEVSTSTSKTMVSISWVFACVLFLYGFDTFYYPRHYLLLQSVSITSTFLTSVELALHV